MTEMTEERLAELEMLLEWHVVNPGIVGVDLSQWLTQGLRELLNEIDRLRADNERLTAWVEDLHSGMYVNCVYCGHRYGPGETTPVSMADALKEHVEQCPRHPMSALRAEVDRWVGHYADLLITGLEIESAHNKLRQSVLDYIANSPEPTS